MMFDITEPGATGSVTMIPLPCVTAGLNDAVEKLNSALDKGDEIRADECFHKAHNVLSTLVDIEAATPEGAPERAAIKAVIDEGAAELFESFVWEDGIDLSDDAWREVEEAYVETLRERCPCCEFRSQAVLMRYQVDEPKGTLLIHLNDRMVTFVADSRSEARVLERDQRRKARKQERQRKRRNRR